MNFRFLMSSGFLFLGGALLRVSAQLTYSDLFFIVSWIFLFMGGIPLLIAWWQGLQKALPGNDPSSDDSDADT